MNSRKLLKNLACALALSLAAAGAGAEESPTRPVKLIVGYSPGGPTDAMARTLANAV